MVIALVIIVFVILAICIASCIIARMIVYGRRQTLDESWQWQQDHVEGTHIFTRDMFTQYIVKGPKGEDIHTAYLPARIESDKYIILCHGYTDCRYGMMKYVPQYYELGFHCILFDERGHGESKPEPCSYGIREIDFPLAVLRDTLERYGRNIRIGLHGESLGGATMLTMLQYDDVKNNVSFAVDDCGFCEIIPVLKGAMKSLKVPPMFVYPASVAARIMYGISFQKARAIDIVQDNHIPLCCFHGAADDFILPEHSKRVYEATKGYKEIHLIEGAGHAESAVVAPEEYGKLLKAFLENIKFI